MEEGKKGRLIRTRAEEERFRAEPHRIVALTREFPTLRGEPVVFARPDRTREALARSLRAEGVRTLAETDDNYFAAPHLNIFARADENWHTNVKSHATAMASMEGVIFSTAWLRDRYYREFKARFHVKGVARREWMPEMFVCRNHIPSWAWPAAEPYDGPIRFGFMGSPSHVHDMAALGYASFHAAKTLGARTFCIGYSPSDPDPDIPDYVEVDGEQVATRTEKSMAMSRTWQAVVDEHVRWVDPALYKRGGLPLDIALCPLSSNDFTSGKSDIKCIEAVVAGAAPVCSNMPVFASAGWKHGVNALMGGSQEELAEAVVRLIREPNLRAELVAAGREMVRAERNEHVLAAEWGAALAG